MQSVVRSTLVLGVFAFAGLTACGDKIVQGTWNTAVDSVVHSVTVSPSSVPGMKIGDKVTLAASVDAGAGVTDRTVQWSSSNTAVVTVDAAGCRDGRRRWYGLGHRQGDRESGGFGRGRDHGRRER